ncbi:MAG: pirin family protein [Acidobacteria bacterium]|nr:pirin family protein [Acidobacteriota bacterium]
MSELATKIRTFPVPPPHWVGDGFPVRSLITPQDPARISPFLLLDYGGPVDFPPTTEKRGVGPHPHKGFETVTIVFDGGVAHRDSSGASGEIGPGDVQWMTAGAGLIHEELHSESFRSSGGPFEMVQLWVNLPSASKSLPPRYQTILSSMIPSIERDGTTVRVISGELEGHRGPAETQTPVNVLDVRHHEAASRDIELPEGHTKLVVALQGSLDVEGVRVDAPITVELGRATTSITIRSEAAAHYLVLTGEPIREPVFAWGPFVMSSRAEIAEAVEMYEAGRLGSLS